jgi:hypothetical protein
MHAVPIFSPRVLHFFFLEFSIRSPSIIHESCPIHTALLPLYILLASRIIMPTKTSSLVLWASRDRLLSS